MLKDCTKNTLKLNLVLNSTFHMNATDLEHVLGSSEPFLVFGSYPVVVNTTKQSSEPFLVTNGDHRTIVLLFLMAEGC